MRKPLKSSIIRRLLRSCVIETRSMIRQEHKLEIKIMVDIKDNRNREKSISNHRRVKTLQSNISRQTDNLS